MPSDVRSPLLDDYLGRVRSHLPVFGGRDILRELESSIRDRIDDMAAAASRAPDDDIVRRALEEIGEPEVVADAYVARPEGIVPAGSRQFAVYTAFIFAVHVVLIGVATTLERPVQFGPLSVDAVASHSVAAFAATLFHALLVDTGLMVFVSIGMGVLARRRRRFRADGYRVDVSPRAAAGRAVLAALVGVVLVAFRDRVFVVVSDEYRYPLFTEWFANVLPLVTAVLAFSVVSDILYWSFGETRTTVAVDMAHGIAGVACMLFLLYGEAILALPNLPEFAQFHEPVNRFLGQLGTLVVGFLALALGLKTIRRAVRFAQL